MAIDPADEAPRARERFLSWKKVRELTGLSRTTAWRLQKAGDFPVPVVISPGRVGWRESEVGAWQASRAPRGDLVDKPPPRRPPVEPKPAAVGAASAPPPVEPRRRPGSKRRTAASASRGQITFDF
jgi:predicted DNA-binding transcriptional regulator AlpA